VRWTSRGCSGRCPAEAVPGEQRIRRRTPDRGQASPAHGRRALSRLIRVPLNSLPIERCRALVDPEVWTKLELALREARSVFKNRRIWNVNSTASGGGVVELLHALLPYAIGAGVDTRWLVIQAEPEIGRASCRERGCIRVDAVG